MPFPPWSCDAEGAWAVSTCNTGDDQRLVVLLRRLAGEGLDRAGDAVAQLVRAGGAVGEQNLFEPGVLELLPRRVLGLGDAVAVEDDRGAGREGARLRHVLRHAEDADGEAVRLHLIDAVAGEDVAGVVAGVDEARSEERRVGKEGRTRGWTDEDEEEEA